MEFEDNSFFGFLKSAFGWCSAVGGLVASLVSFSKLVTGEGTLVFRIMALLGIVFIWGSCFYISFLTKKTPPIFPSLVPGRIKAFPASARKVAAWGIFVVPALALAAFAVITYYARRPADKIIVTVAQFQSLDSTVIGTTNTLISELRTATESYKRDVAIDPIERVIKEADADAAQTIGQERKATIVIWGWHDNVKIRAYFVLLPNNRNYLSVLGANLPMNLKLAGRETGQVQMDLSNDLAFFTLLTVGLARYELRDYAGAIRLIQDGLLRVNAQTPEQDANKEARIAIGHYYLGRAFSDQGNYNDAKVHYLEALKHKPDYESAHLYLGHLHGLLLDDQAATGEFDQAINLYNSLIAQAPQNIDLLNSRAWAYSSRAASESTLATAAEGHGEADNALRLRNKAREDADKAFADYSSVIQLQPTNALAFNNRGLFYYAKGDFARALDDFNKAVALSPGDASPLNNRGATLSRLRRFKEALADYDKVIALRPTSSPSYLSRAFVYLDQRDYRSAIADYTRAIEFEPSNFRAYRNRAWSNLFLGNYEEAAADSQKFLDLQRPCNRNIQYMYVAILNYVSSRKTLSAESVKPKLEQALSDCGPGPTPWPYAVLRFLHHDISEQQLQAEAGSGQDELTEAHAYLGMDYLLSGNVNGARTHFTWIKDNGNQTFDEYPLALAELDRLGSSGK
jgi:tetratricopeptide (TPR) repeat protein